MSITKLFFLICLSLISITTFAQAKPQSRDLTAFVNPFVGTIGSGKTFQGPVLPYGMIQPGPYMRYAEDQKSGTLVGFSHTHLSGMAGGGCETPGDILFMPAFEKGPFISGFSSGFLHGNETASPGYYKVGLEDSKITVELTATTRVGLHRYTFPESKASGVYLKLEKGSLTVKGDEISGCNNNRVYFVARFSKPFKNFEIAANDLVVNSPDTVRSENVKAFFRFETRAGEAILLKVGISMVSIEGARNNLETEMKGWDFDMVREKAKEKWNRELSKIQVEGGTQTEQILFYTALYHSMIHPNIYMDCDRKFHSTNGKIYTITVLVI